MGITQSDMSNEQHWMRLSRVESDLDVLKPQVAGLQTDVQYIRSSIDQLIQHNARADSKQYPWGALVSLLSVFVVVLGGYATMLTQPIAIRTAVNETHIEELQQQQGDNQYNHGRLDAEVEDLNRWIEDVDKYGSRKWVEVNPE